MDSDFDDKTKLHSGRMGLSPETGGGEPPWDERTVRRDPLVGQRIGEYLVRRRIGSGGMGVVYEGEHPVIGRKVAIKIIRQDTSEEVRARDLASEARAVSAIRHRGIIDIFGFGTLPGVGEYLIMEFLEGRPLDEILRDRAPLPLIQSLWLICEVLAALSAAHAKGVIHRDLKPGNIFIVRESNGSEYVKVLDFGLAKQAATPNGATPQTRASIILGTPEYMAPEQACGQPVSPRTDLYAAGIILFEMLTGRLPFQGESPMHIAVQQVHAKPPPPSSVVEGLPQELDALVLSLLAKEPANRPASGVEVADALTELSRKWESEGVLAASETPRGPSSGASPSPRRSGRVSSLSGETRSSAAPSTAVGPTLRSPSQEGLLASGAPGADARTDVMATVPRRRAPALVAVGVSVLSVALGVGVVLFKSSSPPPPPAPVAPPVVPTVEAVVAPPEPVPEPAPVPEPEPEPEPAPESAPRVGANGTLQFVSLCWAQIYVDGRLRGRMPELKMLPLAPGKHRIELRENKNISNPRKVVTIQSGSKTTYNVICPDEG
ncbi:serine/threonine-protein kinase [Archangium primigenium]|uniref:serine/threonine-protein kinase n=1 Tax=[Archangium] primigenium TaxID=2792470 RepID=UPI00195CD7BB|nr:serine/threonine-protein kinase [Archangium primigenium]MBM7119013.1 serine/threonine protein kinase [Archangium primigenium]